MNVKKLERYLRVNLMGPGPRLIKKNYRAAVSQRLRNTGLDRKPTRNQESKNVCRYREPKPAASHCTEEGIPLVQISVNKHADLHFKHTRTILQVIKTSVVGKLTGLQVACVFLLNVCYEIRGKLKSLINIVPANIPTRKEESVKFCNI